MWGLSKTVSFFSSWSGGVGLFMNVSNNPSRRRNRQLRLLLTFLTVLLLAVLTVIGFLSPVGCRPPRQVDPITDVPREEGPPFFQEVTKASGIDMIYRNGEEAGHMAILESVGGGVALFDFDGDGLLDVFIPGGGEFMCKTILGRPGKLYRNLGNWKFEDVTKKVGLDKALFFSHGAFAADFDNDGWPDLLVTGWGGVTLYHNEPDGKGGRRFVDVTKKAGLAAWSKLTGKSIDSLRAAGVPLAILDKLTPLKYKLLERGPFLLELRKILDEEERKRFQDLISDLSENPGPTSWYRLTDKRTQTKAKSSLASLRAANVPDAVLAKLDSLSDRTLERDPFIAELHRLLDKDECERFQDVVLDYAEVLGGWHWATSAAWGDLDGDGYPDLYVCQYGDWSFANHPGDCTYNGKDLDICPPNRFNASQHRLFHNNRDGTFTEVTHTCCIDKSGQQVGLRLGGRGLAVLMVDINQDGKPDVYVANDTTDKYLYLNRSKGGQLILEEMGLEISVACDHNGRPDGSMGLDAADYNRTGRPSLWVTNYENELHALYRNECKDGQLNFIYSTQEAGLSQLGLSYVGWGTRFLDVDLDGWEDLFIGHGHVILHPAVQSPRKQMAVLMHNIGGKFINSSHRSGSYFEQPHNARGVAMGDLNNRGRTDLVVSHLNDPVEVLKNVAQTNNHWLGLDLAGKKNRDVVGARIVVEVDGATLTHFARGGGGSYGSTSDRRHLIGLGAPSEVRRVTVEWPWGEKQTWVGLRPDRYWKLTEGEERPAEIDFAIGKNE
jgi:ASPIC and UnbV/FG-GAP-like repeat